MSRAKGHGSHVMRIPLPVVPLVWELVERAREWEAAELELAREARFVAPDPYTCPECEAVMPEKEVNVGVAHTTSCSRWCLEQKEVQL